MKKIIRGVVAVALLIVVAACGGGTSGDGRASGKVDLSGESFVLGTKGFTEHFILTQMTKLLLEKAGADVTVRDLPSTQQVRKGLEGGDLDMYWEYTGTVWTNFLGHEASTDTTARKLYNQVAAEDLEKNDIKWLRPANFSNTYGIAVRADFAKKNNLTTLSDLARFAKSAPDKLSLCVDESFGDRPDGLPALEHAYGFDWPRRELSTSDYALVFTSLAKSAPCDFGAVYTTDGRIIAQHLTVLEDDKDAFLSYLPALTMKKARYDKVGKRVATLTAPLLKLDQTTMTRLNAKVDVDGDLPEDVAEDWLTSQELL